MPLLFSIMPFFMCVSRNAVVELASEICDSSPIEKGQLAREIVREAVKRCGHSPERPA